MDWILLIQDTVHWRGAVNTVSLGFIKDGELLGRITTISFSERILIHGIN
jgi:hypothetical protein